MHVTYNYPKKREEGSDNVSRDGKQGSLHFQQKIVHEIILTSEKKMQIETIAAYDCKTSYNPSHPPTHKTSVNSGSITAKII